MMLLWACAGVPLGVYNIVSNFNIALQIQPQILTFLSLLTWMQCKYYGNKWPLPRAVSFAVPIGVIMGGIEVGLVFALRQAQDDKVQWPITLMAVLSAVLLCAGVLRHYWDIYQERTVRGISFIFVGLDAMGDVTSLISVVFEPRLDILGMIIYGSELILWMGIVACGGYYNLLPWVKRKIGQRQSHRTRQQQGMARYAGDTNDYRQSESRGSSSVFSTASSTQQGGLPIAMRLRNAGPTS
jgi:type III secretory pathway component EscS